MRGAYKIPTGDWASRDSLADVTEIYLRPEELGAEALQSAPFIPAPQFIPAPHYVPAPLPAARFDLPTLAAFPIGSSPNVRISSRLGAPDATHRLARQRPQVPLLAIGVIGAIVLGVGIGIVVAFSGGSNTTLAAKPVVTAQVVAAPTVTPIVVTPVTPPVIVKPVVIQPVLVDVRIDSQPSGGTATLIDGPNATQLGATPLAVSLDPKHSYDVMVSLEGHTPRVVHVTPVAGQDLVLVLDETTKSLTAPVAHETHRQAPTAPAVVAKGMLRISSKPPCAITIDGRPSGKTTPQAALALSVGSHQITLTNEEQGINLTTEVEISADKSTAVVQDFTK
jgi:PEGA domain